MKLAKLNFTAPRLHKSLQMLFLHLMASCLLLLPPRFSLNVVDVSFLTTEEVVQFIVATSHDPRDEVVPFSLTITNATNRISYPKQSSNDTWQLCHLTGHLVENYPHRFDHSFDHPLPLPITPPSLPPQMTHFGFLTLAPQII